MSLVDHALKYHALHLPLVQLSKGLKAPRGHGWNVLRSSPQSETEVRELFSGNVGIGLLTGGPGGLVGIDQDTKKGKQGPAQWQQYKAAHGIIGQTRRHRSPTGGLHDLYRLPEGVSLPTRIACSLFGEESAIDVMAGADVHSNLVLPPTELVGDKGPRGEPQTPGFYTVVHDAPILPIPPGLLADLLALPPVGSRPSVEAVDWEPLTEEHPEWTARVEALDARMRAEPVYLTGESYGNLPGALRYVALIQRAGPGLLLPASVVWERFFEVYNPRLPEEHRWEPEHEDALRGIFARAYRLGFDKGARPDGEWKELPVRAQDESLSRDIQAAVQWAPSSRLAAGVVATVAAIPAPTTAKASRFAGVKRLDLTRLPPPVVYLVEGIFEENTVNMIVAPPGGWKTWIMYSIGLAVAAGEAWLGKFQTRKTGVLLLDWEMAERRAQRRFHKLLVGRPDPGIFYMWQPGDPYTPSFWEELAVFVKENGIGLILCDSLAGSSGGIDENAAAAKVALTNAGVLDVTIVWIHHQGKGGGKANHEIARGSSAIQAAVDTMYRVTESQDSVEGFSKVSTFDMMAAKNGEGDQESCIPLRFSDEKGLTFREEPTAPVATLDGKILDALRKGPAKGGVKELQLLLGESRDAVYKAVDLLKARGEVRGKSPQPLQIDSPELRAARVKAAIADHPMIEDPRELALQADIHISEVERIQREGIIYKTSAKVFAVNA